LFGVINRFSSSYPTTFLSDAFSALTGGIEISAKCSFANHLRIVSDAAFATAVNVYHIVKLFFGGTTLIKRADLRFKMTGPAGLTRPYDHRFVAERAIRFVLGEFMSDVQEEELAAHFAPSRERPITW
jgi:hypothetical protein